MRAVGQRTSPAKRQVEPVTCSRALAVDGADIARPSRVVSILCRKRLSNLGSSLVVRAF
jgi:hypothetical protein